MPIIYLLLPINPLLNYLILEINAVHGKLQEFTATVFFT
jgi:hypothetical protein